MVMQEIDEHLLAVSIKESQLIILQIQAKEGIFSGSPFIIEQVEDGSPCVIVIRIFG